MAILVFGLISVVSSVVVVSASNPVHSVLGLVLSFVSACGLMLLLQAEFMALVFIVVYVGAIAVLFLFVVMMLNLGSPTGGFVDRGGVFSSVSRMVSPFLVTFGLIAAVSGVLSLCVVQSLYIPSFATGGVGLGDRFTLFGPEVGHVGWVSVVDAMTDLEAMGRVLYTHYFVYLLLGGFVLLVARIGAVALTLKVRTFALAKRQQVFQQIARDAKSAIMLVRNV